MSHEWRETALQREASDYFNSLPLEQRERLGPLLERYRQMGLAEAADALRATQRRIAERIGEIPR